MPPLAPPHFPPATPPGQPVEPWQAPPRHRRTPTLPHTTVAKAGLCDGLLPFLVGLGEALATAKNPEAVVGPEAIAMGQLLLADTRRLLRGEPMEHFIRHLSIEDTRADRFGLALNIRLMRTAVEQFRKRYFGYHPGLNRPAWYLCGDDAVEAARKLLPRDATRPGEAAESASIEDLRAKLARRIEAAMRGRVQAAANEPQPLHRAGGVETPREAALTDWPGIS
jgi:hypothetical protein